MNVIKKEVLSLEEFLKLPPVPHQRYTEDRATTNKVKKMLGGEVRPEHLDVAIVELTETSSYYGKIYEKGWRGIVNGNTRKYFWSNGLSKSVPKNVFATVYLLPDMNSVRECYNTFDSPDATEMKKEKLFGIVFRMHGYNPVSSKIIKGEYLTALNLASHFFDSETYYSTNSKVELLPSQVGLYIEEIKAFDKLCKTSKSWDQALLCAAFMALKKYGTTNKKLLECLDSIDRRAMNTTTKDRDGATHINVEWQSHDRFKNKITVWDKEGGMKETVSFALYWIEKYMEDQKLSQLGFNWKETGKTFFKSHQNNLFSSNNVIKINKVS